MIGLRHQVGGDWETYLEMLKSYEGLSESNHEDYGFQDPSFIFLNLLAAKSGLGIYLLNLISASIFSYGLIVFCLAQPRPWLALVVAVPYLVTVVAMGYTRQSAAIGITMIALMCLERGRIYTFVMLITFAASFHKSALMLLPLIALINKKNRIIRILAYLFIGLLIYEYINTAWIDSLLKGYIDAGMQSSGAGIRILMCAAPALLFVIFLKKFKITPSQASLWFWMSVGGIFLVIALYLSPSSMAVDRVGLYWIPLQIFVLSRIPDLLGSSNYIRQIGVYVIVFYSAVVYFVWLFFADTAFAWLPYQFYPWVFLSQ